MVSKAKSNYQSILHVACNDPMTDYSFSQAKAELKDEMITLRLDERTQVRYSLAIDAIVEKNGVNSEVANKLHIAFRKYKLKLIDATRLERKISNIALRYSAESQGIIQQYRSKPSELAEKLRAIFQDKKFQDKYRLKIDQLKQESKIKEITSRSKSLLVSSDGAGTTEESQESVNLQTDDVFNAGVAASQGAEGQNILLFIGETGTGKSTTINHILDRNLRRIPKEVLGITKLGKDVVIAENPATEIGHKKSKTSMPKVVKDSKNDLAYCDCPGFSDTRGKTKEIYHSLLIIDVIRKAKKVKGFIFFIDCSELKTKRGQAVIENLRFLYLLLKEFKNHQRALMFVITKADRDDNLVDVKKVLQESVEEIARDKTRPKPFRTFCADVVYSGIFEDKLGNRVKIYDPCGPNSAQERVDLLQLFNNLSYEVNVPVEKFGYPVSEAVEASLDMTRVSIIFQLQKVLPALQVEIGKYWESRTESKNVEDTKGCLDEIEKWIKEAKEEAGHFGTPRYLKLFDTLANQINQALNYWSKLNEIGDKKEIKNIEDHLKNLVSELKSIRDKVEKLYYQRMFAIIRSSIETKWQGYAVQSDLEEMRKAIGSKKLSDLSLKEFCEILGSLSVKAGLDLPYKQHLETILVKDNSRRLELEKIIRDNIQEPFRTSVGNKSIKVEANGEKIALSEILKKIKDSVEATNEIWITVLSPKTQNGTLFLDTNMSDTQSKGKTIYIQVDKIEIMKNSVVNLDLVMGKLNCGGSLTIVGQLKGKYEVRDKQLIFTPSANTEAKRAYRFQWPL